MFRALILMLAAAGSLAPVPASDSKALLRAARSSQADLEVAGELAVLPAGSTPYVRYEDLRRLPQETYTVSDDSNFRGQTEISTMAGSSWLQRGAIARSDGQRFRRIIHDPASVTAGAKMPAQPAYDNATLDALTAYFKTFAKSEGADRGKDSIR
jgi:hypothetical protein